MPFGLRNAAQTFQRFIDEVLRGLDFCYAYLDDILVASRNEAEHKEHVEQLFSRLNRYGITINSAKCVFAVKELRRFLGMINFYRRFLPRAAILQDPLNRLLRGRKLKSDAPIEWTTETETAIENLKKALAEAALLTHPSDSSRLAVMVDASDYALGATLQQREGDSWKPLAFHTKSLSPAQRKYSAYDRELLAAYTAVKKFRHSLEGRSFTIYTDHKPLTFAFHQKTEKCTPRQFRYLDYIGQFTSDIRHVSGKNNEVADALSRVESIAQIDYDQLAESQETNEELKELLEASDTSLCLKRMKIPGSSKDIFCDVSTDRVRPFVTQPFRRRAFLALHGLAHPGIKATTKLVKQRFIWPSIERDCREWSRSCLECQRAKITRHSSAPVGNFSAPSTRFEHIHIDLVGPLPVSRGKRYCLTCVDRFTRWPEVIPLENIEAETVALAFVDGWIARFGTPLRVTTDQGRQFESRLFAELSKLLGTTHLRTTAYHPAANGMVERFHRQLKAAIKCHGNERWTDVLPIILLGIRAAYREDLKATASELVYGESVRLPAEFFEKTDRQEITTSETVRQLRAHFGQVQPIPGSRHGSKKIFVPGDLKTATHVFVRVDGVKGSLQNPYEGPYRILKKENKTYVIQFKGKDTTISIDRLKPAYILDNRLDTETDQTPRTAQPDTDTQVPRPGTEKEITCRQQQNRTRSGRTVRFPDRLQVGLQNVNKKNRLSVNSN
ncbi:Transposon Tf2-6 polyprotein [Anthophora plagiata]